jgi:hypothetical protein
MRSFLLVMAIIPMLFACNWAKKKTKDAIHKSGEVVAKGGSEFADGASEGVKKSFENELVFSDELKKKGVSAGRTDVQNTDSTTGNVLSIYMIFSQDFDKNITAKVFDENGKEYGRTASSVKARKGEAHFVDFVFDKRTHIEGRGKAVFD